MEYEILKKPDDILGYVKEVSTIADQNKKTFGFLSNSVYEQMASKGQLWVYVDKEKILQGYLIFGGTIPTLKVFQIYVSSSARGNSIGRVLLEELKEYAKEKFYHSISARVASDLPANSFWQKNGFSIYRQVKGGETTKRIINVRGYVLSDNDLFGQIQNEDRLVQPIGPVLDRAIYALDLNLLLDVFKGRKGYPVVLKILQTGLLGRFSICITPEFRKELKRQSENYSDDQILRWSEVFPELRAGEDISDIADSLRSLIFPFRSTERKSAVNDRSDLMHLAYCISARIDAFITREKALLRASNDISDRYGVAILSPDELFVGEGEEISDTFPLNADFSFSTKIVDNEVRDFLNGFSIPEPIQKILESSLPIKESVCVHEASFNGTLFGVCFFERPTKATRGAIAGLYMDESSPGSLAAIDHFVELAMRQKGGSLYRLNLYIGKGQEVTEQTLIKKGFFRSDDHFVKIVTDRFISASNWHRFGKDLKSICGFSVLERFPSNRELKNTGIVVQDVNSKIQVFSWFDFETVIGPRFLLNPDRDCILVPIRENYANGLIGNVKNQLSLLSSTDSSLLLEKAYFRKSANASIFRRGGIISFYVSGSRSIQELIGFARITYSSVIDVEEAIIKVGRQGVLSREELEEKIDSSGRIHVFTFDNFLEFDRRVSLAKGKKLGLISKANLVSPQRITSNQLKLLIGEAFNA